MNLWRMLLLLLLLLLLRAEQAHGSPSSPSNVIYLVFDDMRSDLGAYGSPAATPHLDQLAAEGLLFRYAFCQISVCSPSRHSFLSGRRPDRNKVWNFLDASPLNASAIPGHFRRHGYLTLGLGKTFHEAGGAWNAEAFWSPDKPYFPYTANVCPHGNEGGGHCTVPDDQIYDWKLRNATLTYLKFAMTQRKATGQPFFLMAGFRDPHAPWAAPKRMYDLYNQSALAVAQHRSLGVGSPLISWSNQLVVRLENGTSFDYGPYSPVPDWVARDQRHAYYSAVSYVDEHVGEILALLEHEGMSGETIVVAHSDHGYHLGEHGEWEKKSNFDAVVRVPLIIKAPGKAKGIVSSTLVDLVDVFPTLSAIAGLPLPPDASQLDGHDLSALFEDPTLALKAEAFHQYPACEMKSFNETRSGCNETPANEFNFMGYSIRNMQWRYTAWYAWNQTTLRAQWEGEFEEELYAHAGDDSSSFDSWDNVNVANGNPAEALALRTRLRQFFDRQY